MTYLFFLMMLLPAGEDINYETARLEKRLKAVRISDSITLDGKLNESTWLGAPKAADFIQNEPREGEPSLEKTDVRVLFDNQNLYFGVYAHDSSVKNVVISDLKKDFGTDSSDVFEIVLDTFHDERNGYIFSINAAGAKRDAQMINEGREINASWDAVWDVRTTLVDDGWIAEIAIPLKTLKFRKGEAQTWGVNFHRGLRSNLRNEDSFWSPLPRIYNIQRVSLAGTLEGLEGIRPGSNIRVKPYISSSLSQNGVTDRNKGDADFGVDVKYGVTSGLTWDFTYNTDFSQVEADEQQINLTRFSLFFPEKREFFLENSGIFKFAGGEVGGGFGGAVGGRSNQLGGDIFFFSRNIGLSADGQAVPIIGGTRLTGRAGGYEVGMLTMQQKAYGAAGATNFAVARVKRNIWANSDIGVMVMNKDMKDSPLYNRVIGTDANFRFGRFTTANASIAKSFTPGIVSNDYIRKVALGYEDNNLMFRSSFTDIDDNFINQMGYTPRRGIQRWGSNVRWNIRPRVIDRWVRQFQPHWVVDYVMDSKGNFDSKQVDFHLPVTFQNGAWMEMGWNPTVEILDKPFRLNSTTTIPAGEYSSPEWFLAVRPDSSRKIQPTGRVGMGQFYGGYKRTYTIGTTWRVNYKLNTSVQYTRNNIELPGRNDVHTDLVTSRFNYSFSTAVFLNALIQYNSDLNQWNTNVRFNIIHRPLSDIFLVYQERRNSLTGNMLDRAIIAKMTYMLSR